MALREPEPVLPALEWFPPFNCGSGMQSRRQNCVPTAVHRTCWEPRKGSWAMAKSDWGDLGQRGFFLVDFVCLKDPQRVVVSAVADQPPLHHADLLLPRLVGVPVSEMLSWIGP